MSDKPPKPAAKHKPGRNPNTLQNLRPRSPIYDEEKHDRRLTVTDSGWLGCKAIASELGLTGISDLLERLGRLELTLTKN